MFSRGTKVGLKSFWEYLITDPKKKKRTTRAKAAKRARASSKSTSKPTPKTSKKITHQKTTRHVNHEIHQSTAKRKLGHGVLLFILINAILGSSLFYLPGLGVSSSGSASILAWIFVFTFASFIMLYIGELLVLHPSSGGTYAFCKRAYGRFPAFMAGWLLWLAGNLGMALNIVAAAQYFIPGTSKAVFITQIIFSIIWIIALNFMAYRGIDAGVTMLVAFGALSLIVVSLMTIPAFINIPAALQGTFTSPFNSEFLHPFFQWEGLGIFSYFFLSVLLILEAFFGFDTITYLGNEAREPRKLHKVLFQAMAICGAIMTVYILGSLGTVPFTDYVNNARPFAVQAFNTMGALGQEIVVFGMYLVIIGAAAAWPITSSRLIQAMAKDGLFLKSFAKVHPKHRSPTRAVLFQTLFISLFTWLIFRGYLVQWGDPYRTAYLIYVLLALFALSLILFAVPLLRRKEKYAPRHFRAPFPTAGPVIITSFFLFLIINWILIEGSIAFSIINLAASFVILGLPLYFMIEVYYDPKAIIKVNEFFSYFVLATEKIHFPFSIRKRIFKELTAKKLKKKTILEYGCSIGSLTRPLAKIVGPKGKVIATDLALHNVNTTDRRTKHLTHVFVHHHPDLKSFSLKRKESFDFVLSVGMLSSMQDPKAILSGLAKRVKKGAEVVFVDYDKFFYFISNVTWIESKAQLKNVFKKAGFDVEISKKRSLFWTYLIIRGKRR